jgi:methylmalonyl-CoA/ethylmalonyl-CoA epimerase
MRDPVFTDVHQIAVVVPDLDAALRVYVEEYGIGPWQIFEYGPDNGSELIVDDEPVEYAMRVAITTLGPVEWELIEPLDDRSDYARFLAEKGSGVHHVAVGISSYDDTLRALRDKGRIIRQGGRNGEVTFAYMSTDDDLGVIAEIVDWPAGTVHIPAAIYPPGADAPSTRTEGSR